MGRQSAFDGARLLPRNYGSRLIGAQGPKPDLYRSPVSAERVLLYADVAENVIPTPLRTATSNAAASTDVKPCSSSLL
jgi:hypothetical protein